VLFEPLRKRIELEGESLGGGILKVDPFINHQVDPVLMDQCGRALAELFADTQPTKVLTAEISGIAPALMTAKYLNVSVVYARKHKPVTMPDTVYLTVAPSHTKGRMVELIVSPEYLGEGERILIIDDFLASGSTIAGLVRLAKTAGATLVGIGTLIEKTFEGGRELLSSLNVPVEALVPIASLDHGQIIFAQD
jgi:xanthine phosphoribosyltransferase